MQLYQAAGNGEPQTGTTLLARMGPILGGLTAQYLGYQELIIGSTVLLATAFTLTTFLVQEPRRAD
jgi:hypothetical protein